MLQALAPRVIALRRAVQAHPGSVLVGSSYGGLAAMALLLDADPLPISALVLLAPALHWTEDPITDLDALQVPEHLPATVVHGVADGVVPIAVSRQLVVRCPHVVLLEQEDDHRLGQSLDTIAAVVAGYVG